MQNTHSSKGKYILAALIGVAVGGSIVALTSRAAPKMMSGMMAKCKQMMAGMAETNGGAGDMCQRMMASMGQARQQQACHSQGESCHGGD